MNELVFFFAFKEFNNENYIKTIEIIELYNYILFQFNNNKNIIELDLQR